jgi:hypothetical protein
MDSELQEQLKKTADALSALLEAVNRQQPAPPPPSVQKGVRRGLR